MFKTLTIALRFWTIVSVSVELSVAAQFVLDVTNVSPLGQTPRAVPF